VQELLVESDVHLDPQALVLAPRNAITIASELVKGRTHQEAPAAAPVILSEHGL
jgi:hypothetical protein